MIPLYLEIHVDEWLLVREPARWDQAAELLSRLAGLAEATGNRLCFRVREHFVEGDRSHFLFGLVQRGHEVGWHRHGGSPHKLVAALKKVGVIPTVAAPGLVQVGERGRQALLEQTKQYADRITDRLETRHFAYQGWLVWPVIPGLWSLDISVSPFSWGVLQQSRSGVEHRFGGLQWEELARRAKLWSSFEVPEGYSGFFGAVLHEHNLCAKDSLVPIPQELERIQRFLGEFSGRIIPSGQIPARWPEAPRSSPAPPAWLSRARRLLHLARQPALEKLPIADRFLKFQRWAPYQPARGWLVVVAGGSSGLEQKLGFLNLLPEELNKRGIGVICFERTPKTSRLPGNPIHQEDTLSLVSQLLKTEQLPLGILSWSAGLIPAVHAAMLPKVRFLIDCEGPTDRFSVVPPQNPDPALLARDPGLDSDWAGIEALESLKRLNIPYLRLQGSQDHVHGSSLVHAWRAVQAAKGTLLLLPGAINRHSSQLLDRISAMFPPSC